MATQRKAKPKTESARASTTKREEKPASKPRAPRQRALPASPTRIDLESTAPLGRQLGTAALVGVAAALIEIELLPGLLLGVAAMVLPRFLPQITNVAKPLTKTLIRAGRSAAHGAQAAMAEANERVHDMMAELDAESPGSDGSEDSKAVPMTHRNGHTAQHRTAAHDVH